jgi:hypothetical protein
VKATQTALSGLFTVKIEETGFQVQEAPPTPCFFNFDLHLQSRTLMEAQVQNAVEIAMNPDAEYNLKQQVSPNLLWLLAIKLSVI